MPDTPTPPPTPDESTASIPTQSSPPLLRRDAASLAPGDRLGEYRILRAFGQGGMGSVYEAEQDRPSRRVALKLIRPGYFSSAALRRFELEAEALGRLQHPGIAQIYEAGVTDMRGTSQPYIAMEFIVGRPLDEYAKTTNLDLRTKLELFARICDAVQHAHQRGVIHRDLKPGNILVDETGQPKVVDFGLARVVGVDSQLTAHTEAGAVIGTLRYMSPEQAAGDVDAMDTRTDVYSLGLILYELLSGRPPYEIAGRALHEAVRVIREDEPARLSSANRSYGGDLEVIAAKALEKEKERRYVAAADVAADIRRFLRDEPVLAQPPSVAYQLRKFAKRHRGFVISAALVLISLITGLGISLWQAVRAERAEADALAERAVVLTALRQKEAELKRSYDFMLNLQDPSWEGTLRSQRSYEYLLEASAICLLAEISLPTSGESASSTQMEKSLRLLRASSLLALAGQPTFHLRQEPTDVAATDLRASIALERETPSKSPWISGYATMLLGATLLRHGTLTEGEHLVAAGSKALSTAPVEVKAVGYSRVRDAYEARNLKVQAEAWGVESQALWWDKYRRWGESYQR